MSTRIAGTEHAEQADADRQGQVAIEVGPRLRHERRRADQDDHEANEHQVAAAVGLDSASLRQLIWN